MLGSPTYPTVVDKSAKAPIGRLVGKFEGFRSV